MINHDSDEYKFAIGKKIKRIFTESELYLDGRYNENYPFEKLSVIRLDKPIFILLENDLLLRLISNSLSFADASEKRHVLSEEFKENAKAQKVFEQFCGLSFSKVQKWYENKYEIEENAIECLDSFGNLKNFDEPSDLVIVFDNGSRLISYSFFDYFDVEIVE